MFISGLVEYTTRLPVLVHELLPPTLISPVCEISRRAYVGFVTGARADMIAGGTIVPAAGTVGGGGNSCAGTVGGSNVTPEPGSAGGSALAGVSGTVWASSKKAHATTDFNWCRRCPRCDLARLLSPPFF